MFKGYTRLNNTLLFELQKLSKYPRLVFTFLRIRSSYTTHLTKPLSVQQIADAIPLPKNKVSAALKFLRSKNWIAKLEVDGNFVVYDICIARLTNEELSAKFSPGLSEKSSEKSSGDSSPGGASDYDDSSGYRVLSMGSRFYRYNLEAGDFESRYRHQDVDAWVLVNGERELLTDDMRTELSSLPYLQ